MTLASIKLQVLTSDFGKSRPRTPLRMVITGCCVKLARAAGHSYLVLAVGPGQGRNNLTVNVSGLTTTFQVSFQSPVITQVPSTFHPCAWPTLGYLYSH
jgi:hypothetical protein